MPTIDNFDISVYIDYARRMQMLEGINRQYHLQDASSIPPQTSVIDLYPKLSELDLLLGVARTYAPWALFLPPQRFLLRRKASFSFSRVAPTFGGEEEEEKYLNLLKTFPCKTKQEQSERESLLGCLNQMNEINDWLGEIIGKMGQFLQG